MDKGVVKSGSGLYIRFKPNGVKIGVLEDAEEFSILDEVTFFRIKTKDGMVGYVHGSYVDKIPEFSARIATPATKPRFNPIVYTNESFMGEAVKVDEDFVPELDKLADYASRSDLKIWTTSSLRPLNNQVDGAIMRPASNSCHHIGHAIDMNLFHRHHLYTSSMLRKDNHPNLPEEVSGFFELIRADKVLRWGGDFREQDPVHIDDNYFNERNLMYLAKLDNRVELLNA